VSETEWLGDVPDPTSKWGLPGDDAAAARMNNEAEVPVEDNAQTERPRDEQGRFVAQEEGQVEERQAEQPAEDDLPEKYRGKTPAEIAKMHMEVERAFHSRDEEVTRLRQLEQQQQFQPAPQPNYDLNAVLEESPSRAAEMAYRSGDQNALAYVLDSWDAMSPGAKDLWIENKQNAQKISQMEERQRAVEVPIQQQQASQTYAQAYTEITAQHPDFDSLQTEMSQVADEISQRSGRSFVTELLQSNDPKVISEGFEYLYLKARDRKTGNLSEVSRQLASEHVENVNQAKQDALVASASTGAGETPEPSTAQRVKQSWDKLNAPFAASEDGWNV
jgi:hypothetical protein